MEGLDRWENHEASSALKEEGRGRKDLQTVRQVEKPTRIMKDKALGMVFWRGGGPERRGVGGERQKIGEIKSAHSGRNRGTWGVRVFLK